MFYKATRLDGTDFRTGKIEYRVGETVTHPGGKMVRDDPSTYLSVATVATDCTGFRWPCRLFVVEGVGRGLRAEGLPNKRCFRSVRVVEELPAYEVFGPQGELVAGLIERAKRLTPDEGRRLAAARDAVWDAARGAARGAAWDAVWFAARGRDAAWDAAWFAARGAARGAAWDAVAARDAARDAAWDAVWFAAWFAAWGAAALLTRDLISEEQFDILYGPWREVIGGD